MSKEFWDQMYRDEAYRFGTQPNAFLAESVPSRVAAAFLAESVPSRVAAGKSIVCLRSDFVRLRGACLVGI